MEEIKADFSKRNLSISSEQEIISNIDQRMKQDIDTQSRLLLLADLEFYLHNLDNAVYYTDIGGMSRLLNLLNSTANYDLASDLMLAIGAGSQR